MKPKLDPLEDKIAYAKKHGYDCIVQCPTCKRTQYLEFKNGLRNGWSTCCNGYTTPIIWHNADIDAAVSGIVKTAFNSSNNTEVKKP